MNASDDRRTESRPDTGGPDRSGQAGVPKIRLRGVRKAFGAKQVLDGVDLDVEAGHSMVILGGSGSGKSVTIKCILGLIEPDSGSIEIDGQDVLRLPRRDIEIHSVKHLLRPEGLAQAAHADLRHPRGHRRTKALFCAGVPHRAKKISVST